MGREGTSPPYNTGGGGDGNASIGDESIGNALNMADRPKTERRGLPGGILPPFIGLLAFAALFVLGMTKPDLVDLGPRMHPAGVGVIGAALTLFWLLAAIGARPTGPKKK